jgi:hypothetical protein
MSLLERPETRQPHTGDGNDEAPVPDTRGGGPETGLRRSRSLLFGTAVAATVIGLFLTGATVLAPDAVDKVTGNLKVFVDKQVANWVAPGELPMITLGGEGNMRDLDRCGGEFTEMVSYRADGVLPLYSAHNHCGGDIILTWDIGQHVTVAGSDVVYEVVEERHTPKSSNADSLVGMAGEFMLQTCYYGENRMRFLSLAPVAG